MKLTAEIASSYKKPVLEAAVLSVLLLVFSAMILDMGETLFAAMFALAGFWAGVLLMVLRRPHSPTKVDLQLVRFGSLPLFLAAQFLVRWILYLRGEWQ